MAVGRAPRAPQGEWGGLVEGPDVGREDREELGPRFQPQVPGPRLGRLGTFVSSRSSLLSETQTFPGSPRLSPEGQAGSRPRGLSPVPGGQESKPLSPPGLAAGRGLWTAGTGLRGVAAG